MLTERLDGLDFDGTWENFRDQVYSVGAEVLGFRTRKHQDWFDDNDPYLNQLLQINFTQTYSYRREAVSL